MRLSLELPDLASAVIFRSESRGTHDRTLSDSTLPQPGRPCSRTCTPSPGTKWRCYSPRHWLWQHLSESELYYDRRSVGQSVLVSSPHLGLMTRFLLLSDHCGFLIWGALSDERTGLSLTCTMYNIQYILLSQIWDSPNWRTRSLYLYPPGTGWPGYTPRHWGFPLSDNNNKKTTTFVWVWVILRPTVSRPVCLGIKPPSGGFLNAR
jgi:hypothetical protein